MTDWEKGQKESSRLPAFFLASIKVYFLEGCLVLTGAKCCFYIIISSGLLAFFLTEN